MHHLKIVVVLMAYTVALVSALPFLGELDSLLDIWSSFRIQYLALGIFLLALSLFINGSIRVQAVLVLTICVNFYEIDFSYKTPNSISDITIFHANVLSSNRNYELLIQSIQENQPDIIGVQEITESWSVVMDSVFRDYKYREVIPSDDNFGIGIYSKIPFESSSTCIFTLNDMSSIIAKVRVKQQTIELVYTHPVPPISSKFFRHRNEQLNAIAQYVSTKDNIVVFGDLNMSPWSIFFKKFLNNSNLEHYSSNIKYTWPVRLVIMGTPIDHILGSKDLEMRVKKLPSIGSDHFPLLFEIEL